MKLMHPQASFIDGEILSTARISELSYFEPAA
jgi:hypothetical protein